VGVSWLLRLCVALAIFIGCIVSVMTASSTSAGHMRGSPVPATASDFRGHQIWSLLGPVNQVDGDNGDNGDGDGDGDNEDGDNDDGDNAADNDNGDDGEDDDDDGDDNESVTFELPPLPPPPPRTTTPSCTSPGEETVFTSRDGKATLRVFPTMAARLRITVAPSYDLLSLPPLPGRLAGLLIYDVAAAPCDGGTPLAELPAEVNLTVHYTEDDVFNVDEPDVRFSWLDPATNSWQHVEKQEIDPARNAIGATITRTGRYILYEDP
jgi:hypothetical protein